MGSLHHTIPAQSNLTDIQRFMACRYRVLFSTLLAGSDKVDEGLVQQNSPFAGSRRFGMCYYEQDSKRGRLSAIGTTLEIHDVLLEDQGRMIVTNKGIERFKIIGIIKEAPVLICEVEVLPEDQDDSEQVSMYAKLGQSGAAPITWWRRLPQPYSFLA